MFSRSTTSEFAYNLFAQGLHRAAVAVDQLAFFIYQKLVEIPAYLAVFYAIEFFAGEPFVDGMGFVALHGDFFGHHESYAIVLLAKSSDVFLSSWLLSAKVVAWKADYHHFVAILLVQLFELFVLRSISALRSSVHEEDFFAFEVRQLNGFTVDAFETVVVDVFGWWSHQCGQYKENG